MASSCLSNRFMPSDLRTVFSSLREWFDAQDAEETDELLAAIDEGIRSAETERTFSLEEVRGEIKKWATKSA